MRDFTDQEMARQPLEEGLQLFITSEEYLQNKSKPVSQALQPQKGSEHEGIHAAESPLSSFLYSGILMAP